jgi:hypothetical protein
MRFERVDTQILYITKLFAYSAAVDRRRAVPAQLEVGDSAAVRRWRVMCSNQSAFAASQLRRTAFAWLASRSFHLRRSAAVEDRLA